MCQRVDASCAFHIALCDESREELGVDALDMEGWWVRATYGRGRRWCCVKYTTSETLI